MTATRADQRIGAATAGSPGWFLPGLVVITLLGLVGRFVYLVRSKVDKASTFTQGDAFWYSSTAHNLGRGKLFVNAFDGTVTADHPPLTVLLLGPAAVLFPDSTYAQRVTMTLLGAATIAVIGLAARRLAGPVAGLAAAALAAVSPSLWVSDVLIMSETPAALLVALVLWAGIALAERPTTRLVILAGALCGLAALARAETGLFLPLMVWPMLALARDFDWRRRLRLAALATAATVAVIAPWTVLNLTRFQEPVSLSTNDGLTLVGSNCDTTYRGRITGGWTIEPCVTDVYDMIDSRKPPLTEAQREAAASDPSAKPCTDPNQARPPCWDSSRVSKLMRSEGARYIGGHLDEVPRVVLIRNARVWGWYRFDQGVGIGAFEGRRQWVSRWGFYTTWALLPVAAAGAILIRRRRISLIPFGASLLVVVVVTSSFYGLVRFRLPYDVASCLLVGVAAAALFDRRRGPPEAAPSPGEPSDRTGSGRPGAQALRPGPQPVGGDDDHRLGDDPR